MAWALALFLFTLAFLRTAWIAEDSFITLRVVDNTLNGLGLVWNPGERVQTFTHPMWFGLLVGLVAIVGDPYVATMLLSYVLLLITLALVRFAVAELQWPALIAIFALLWSRSFIDYSSSGLENPLTHTLIAGFIFAWLHMSGSRQTLVLSLITSGLFLSRPDVLLLVAPAMTLHILTTRRSSLIVAGSIPAVLWIGFSLFYYGAPLPNTALAKVATGQSFATNALQAWEYLKWTVANDLVSAILLLGGIALGFSHRRLVVFGVGLIFWLVYLAYVGADYMGGRFFAAPVFLSALVVALAASRFIALILAAALALCFPVLGLTVFSGSDFEDIVITKAGIADERGYYYQMNGLIPSLKREAWFSHPQLIQGRSLRQHPGWYMSCTIGMIAFAAGPNVRWIDPLALAEPFLARLPSRAHSRIGHYERAFPDGFVQSVVTGKNNLTNPELNSLFNDVSLATRSPLITPGRLSAIWRLNVGHHSHAALHFDKDGVGSKRKCK